MKPSFTVATTPLHTPLNWFSPKKPKDENEAKLNLREPVEKRAGHVHDVFEIGSMTLGDSVARAVRPSHRFKHIFSIGHVSVIDKIDQSVSFKRVAIAIAIAIVSQGSTR